MFIEYKYINQEGFHTFCTGFMAFLIKGKSLLDYTNLFSSNKYEKNDIVILKYFQELE